MIRNFSAPVLFTGFLVSLAPAQSFEAQQVITAATDYAVSVYATDLDGDGDADVLSASSFDDMIAWYENLGGGVFGPLQVITTSADYASSVYATDLDGDGDADVLSASSSDDKIAWYENLGGGAFGSQQIITSSTFGANSVSATDLDGDGDVDVLAAGSGGFVAINKVAWYENLGGGNFGNPRVITTSAEGVRTAYATDLDGDGDPDVLTASFSDDTIAWYENQGGGVFSPLKVVTANADGALSAFAVDLDGDGDADVLSASSIDNTNAWYENLGGGTFGPQQLITASTSVANGPTWVYAADLDGDGDADVLTASRFDDKIAWHENVIGESGVRYCSPAVPNSTGQPGVLTAIGSADVMANDLTMVANQLPTNAFGFFLASLDQGLVMGPGGSQGNLCLGGAIGRYVGPGQIKNAGALGTFDLPLDLTMVPTPTALVAALPGETWNFQAWYRDVNPGVTSNFTSAVAVTLQ